MQRTFVWQHVAIAIIVILGIAVAAVNALVSFRQIEMTPESAQLVWWFAIAFLIDAAMIIGLLYHSTRLGLFADAKARGQPITPGKRAALPLGAMILSALLIYSCFAEGSSRDLLPLFVMILAGAVLAVLVAIFTTPN